MIEINKKELYERVIRVEIKKKQLVKPVQYKHMFFYHIYQKKHHLELQK